MKRFKKIIKYLGIVILLLIFFRGFLYRMSINYSTVRSRENISLTDEKLILQINEQIENKILNIEQIIKLSNSITSEQLNFTFGKASANPNALSELEKANCIGYSALFNSIGNYIIRKQNVADQYAFVHLIGKLDVFGYDIHSLFDSPFFKDHDFNEIQYLSLIHI